jgi:5'-deoxynucleotidase YfbR-like HD superfamily hydrolase
VEQHLETWSGYFYEFLDPKQEQIHIVDIAYALSNKARFSGHTQFYSVAEHSVAVAKRLPKRLQLAGLLHDAAEAYLGDIPSPLKHFLPDFKRIEAINELAINKKFKLDKLTQADWAEVKQADLQALFNEARVLITSQGRDWSMFKGKEWKTDDIYPMCLYPEEALRHFMFMFDQLVNNN